MRYVPKMNGLEMVKRIREQLDRNGYKDVEMKVIGDVPWSKMSYDTDIARAMTQAYEQFNIPHGEPAHYASILGGYWPAYLFSNQEVGQKVAPVSMPIGMGGAGHGGNAHAANEYYIIEGAGKVYGMAGAEKVQANEIDDFAIEAILLNAAANKIIIDVLRHNLIGQNEGWDVVLAGDVCYERPMADRVIPWLRALAGKGVTVLMGDPGRAYLPQSGLLELARYQVPTSLELEDRTQRETIVWRLMP